LYKNTHLIVNPILGADGEQIPSAAKGFSSLIVDILGAALLQQGQSDTEIAKHLGMEAEEVLRLKQMTGLAGLFTGQSYSKAWEAC
jgi:hypothetical protein